MKRILAAVVLTLVATAWFVRHQQENPPSSVPEVSKEEFLDHSVTIDLLGDLTTLQVGYIYPRPESLDEIADRPEPWDSIAIEFWMPSREYVRRQRLYPSSKYNSSEIPDNYMVKMSLFNWDENKRHFSRPSVLLHNSKENLDSSLWAIIDDPEQFSDWHCTEQGGKTFYYIQDKLEWQAECSCDDFLYPSCRNLLYWPDAKFGSVIIIQKQRIGDLGEIIDGANNILSTQLRF